VSDGRSGPAVPTDLVARLRAGDDEAGRLLESAYRAPLVRFARGYVGTVEAAEDAVQEVFVKVLAAEAVPDDFRAWIYRIARNHCLNLVRARGRRRDGARLATGADVAAALAGPSTRAGEVERRARLATALSRLPGAQQEALRLRYSEGLSRGEIARVLDVAESLVKSRLFEALESLRRASVLRSAP
jgi:RNA polymerase sigma-70 factor (ECF subfamily)